MKKLILLLLLLPLTASAQFPMVASWQSAAVATWTPLALDSSTAAITVGWYVAADVGDSLGKADGDTTYILPDRMRWHRAHYMGPLYQTTAAKKPTYLADSSALLFDGIDDDINTLAGIRLAQPLYVYIAIHRYTGGVSPVYFDGIPNSAGRCLVINGAGLSLNAANAYPYAGSVVATGSGLKESDSLIVLGARFNGTSSYLRINGTNQGADGSAGANYMENFVVGNDFNGGPNSAIKATYREIVIVHGTMTDAEVLALETYLKNGGINNAWSIP